MQTSTGIAGRCAAVALLALPSVSQAALVNRGGGLIYDDVLNVTWLQDANYAQTSGYDDDGRMTWDAANTWASNLVYAGYDDWRLPTALNADGTGPCSGFNCSSSELGHMFYNNMGAVSGQSILSGTNSTNLALFSNLQSYVYWSGTDGHVSSYAFVLGTDTGGQTEVFKPTPFYAWAVRPGDVSPVPLPAAAWLLLSGLGGLAALGRRRASRTG